MNPGFSSLQAYPFERLRGLYAGLQPANKEPVNLSIGEPKHRTPEFIQRALIESIDGTNKYPSTRGTLELRSTIAAWLTNRFKLAENTVDPDKHVLPVNGTREALFAIAQCLVDRDLKSSVVVMPNPFYQIYEGAALLAGAQPVFMDTSDGYDFQAIDNHIWENCQMVYVCSPGNPSGQIISQENYATLLALADQYNFIIVADECYSELYYDESTPPLGLLQAAHELGVKNHKRCLVMHSLSKRSNAPGLRSGFVAGDPDVLEKFFQYRTYHGSAMSLHVQQASIAAWQDETHVRANRALYRDKFDAVVPILASKIKLDTPPAGFYLWPDIGRDDMEFCRLAMTQQNVQLLPGQFLAREVNGVNPGQNRIRLALVEQLELCIDGAERLAAII